jgi:ketosteroid isomerase-like protein
VEPAVETFVAALDRGDADAALGVVCDDVVLHLPGERTEEGPAGVRAFAAEHGIVEDRRVSLALMDLRTLESGDQVAGLHRRAEDRDSAEVLDEERVGAWFQLREDRIAALRTFPTVDEALAAAADRP